MHLTAIDLFSDENLDDPWDILRQLRDAGPVTYMEVHDIGPCLGTSTFAPRSATGPISPPGTGRR